jgi:hypothetical protein
MNVRLQYNIDFTSINILDNRIYPNNYTCKLSMLTASDDSYIQNISFERVKFIFREIFHHGIMINVTHTKLKNFMEMSPEKMIVLPDDPYDQVIGMIIFSKLNAIMDGNMILEELAISSGEGDNIIYIVDESDSFGPITTHKKQMTPWWCRSDLSTLDTKKPMMHVQWSDIDMGWDLPSEEETEIEFIPEPELLQDPPKKKKKVNKNNIIEVVDLSGINNNNKPAFTPTILNGGKDPDDKK